MLKTIKVRCNGAGEHINEIDIDKILRPVIVIRGTTPTKPREIPERTVFKCKFCTAGRVVVTKEMVEEALQHSQNNIS
ncbi:MAG: hypothetical protein ONB44_07175 [candidate division KSB1 bacterium]|nr:hypothetical protein [candidate division KSB1 bacterium]MDZ7301907.1 hypothetical protein [candidate division KSB1 bacterium]MDZ7314262.1 hypothetical protein [candidate division KSB1 bacterium]